MNEFNLFAKREKVNDSFAIVSASTLADLGYNISRKGIGLVLKNMSTGEFQECFSSVKCYANVDITGRNVTDDTIEIVDNILQSGKYYLRVDLIELESLDIDEVTQQPKNKFYYEKYTLFDSTQKVYVEKNADYGVIDLKGNVIVPFGKYDWIDAFWRGFARVKKGEAIGSQADNGNKWGVVNEQGEEVVPVEYDSIWNFFNTKYDEIILIKDGKKCRLRYDAITSNKQHER